jgi:hypothetical protein
MIKEKTDAQKVADLVAMTKSKGLGKLPLKPYQGGGFYGGHTSGRGPPPGRGYTNYNNFNN